MLAIRPWPALVAVNLVLAAALVWTTARSQPEPTAADVLRARLIELVNEEGEMRAQLHLGEDGGGNLRLRSGPGEIRVKFGATDDGAILLLMDRVAERGIRLATDRSGSSLTLIDPDGRQRTIKP